MTASVLRRVLRLGRLERRHAGRDRLGAGQGDRARGEGAQEQEDRDGLGASCRPGARASRAYGAALAERRRSGTTPMAIISRAEPTNRYVGTAKMLPDSRRPRRLPIVISAIATTPIIDPLVEELRDGRGDLLDGRRRRDGDRHDVVDEQRRRPRRATPAGPKFALRDGVRAAAGRVGAADLAVAETRRRSSRHGDRDADREAVGEARRRRRGSGPAGSPRSRRPTS